MQQSHSSQQSQSQWQPAPAQVQAPRRCPAGGFLVQGDQTLYTALSTGHSYGALRPPPYPCLPCNGMHWSFHPCPAGAQQPQQQ